MAQVKAIALRAAEVSEIWKTEGERDDTGNKIANS